jgi:hypothetical protein
LDEGWGNDVIDICDGFAYTCEGRQT